MFGSSVFDSSTRLAVPVLTFLAIVSSAFGYNATFLQREVNGKCNHLAHHSNGRIISHLGTTHYADNKDCQVTISVAPGKRLFLRFDRFDITDSVNCFQDEVLVYDGTTISSPMLTGRLYGLCGSLPRQYRTMHSSSNEVTVRFITDDVTSDNQGFAISYVSYVPTSAADASDSNNCFACRESSMCIDRHLMCDNLWHCPEGSDESFQLCYESPDSVEESSGHGWLSWTGTHVAMAFAVAAVLFIISSLIFCCCCHQPSSETLDDSNPQVITDANMYYMQQAKPDVASSAPQANHGKNAPRSRNSSNYTEHRYDVVNAEASDAMIGFPSVSEPSALNTANSDWWEVRRSCGDGCQAGMPTSYEVYEHHHHMYPNCVEYESETTSPLTQEYYVPNMSFIEQQELRWQHLTGQHHTRVSLPPEGGH
ncbi:uncharacterized protein LOC577140 [Strongylocentrotus purpuratus]|uniref:CUB domain-containing protein n=1 Tax=Strongylocentrotus purpuratus TaxID=7668 RepID=A0A7M7RAC9_STRPU|nr:uncharacterized protein LOC577140 [Strongylocentrotus purpuratus]